MIDFDEATHTYSVGGVVVPGVTQILAGFTDLGRIPRDVLEAKRRLGHAVHRAIELYEAGTLDAETIDPIIMPYLEGWIRFASDTKLRVHRFECIVYSPRHGYAGRLDLVVEFLATSNLGLLDVKCVASMSPETALQTAAYTQALFETHGERIQQRAGLQLLPDGKYRLHPYKDRTDIQIFLNAVALSNWKRNHA